LIAPLSLQTHGYRFVVNSRGNMLFTCRWMLNKMEPKVLIFICHGTNEFSLPPFFHLCFDYALGKLNNVTSNISHFARIWGRVQCFNGRYNTPTTNWNAKVLPSSPAV
jgi:hypothetical protein